MSEEEQVKCGTSGASEEEHGHGTPGASESEEEYERRMPGVFEEE